jgi:4-hydroxybenzoyl-CoA thioesterase
VKTPFVYAHRVRLQEVDAAGIVYFAHLFSFCHDAMAAMLEPLDGGYTALVARRRLGLPTVHVEADFVAPLRFGDDLRISVFVERVGTSSCALRFELARAPDGGLAATIRHVVVLTDLAGMRSAPLPDDVRSLFERYVVADATP